MKVEDFNFKDLPQNFKESFYLEIPKLPSERLPTFSWFAITSHDTVDVKRMDALLKQEINTENDLVHVPIMISKGLKTGPTLVAFAGVKGDEYEGMKAIMEVYKLLDPSQMKGNFVGVLWKKK